MGNPTILLRKKLDTLWECSVCENIEEFEEDWNVEIIQDKKEKSQEINLVESVNIKCAKCGSHDIREIEA